MPEVFEMKTSLVPSWLEDGDARGSLVFPYLNSPKVVKYPFPGNHPKDRTENATHRQTCDGNWTGEIISPFFSLV